MSRENQLLPYSYMFTQLCFSSRVQELPGIDELIDPINTIKMRLIRGIVNQWPDKKEEERMIADIFVKTEVAETDATMGGDIWTERQPSDIARISSATLWLSLYHFDPELWLQD